MFQKALSVESLGAHEMSVTRQIRPRARRSIFCIELRGRLDQLAERGIVKQAIDERYQQDRDRFGERAT